MKDIISDFLRKDSAGGILLIAASLIAIIFANSFLHPLYQDILNIPVQIRFGTLDINKPFFLWVNDGLMAIFFFTVGLELKREMIVGELSNIRSAMLPVIGAIGGIAVPGLIYSFFNYDHPESLAGWAIPTATDIAFALGILSMLGNRVPLAMKIFLATLAIVDDIGAIIIIALFYTTELSALSLGIAAACIAILITLNRRGVSNMSAYLLIGIVLWISVLKSGVHATLAGVILAFCIPYKCEDVDYSPVEKIEHDLNPAVAFFILPLFAFVNAGVPLSAESLNVEGGAIPLGIICGLFFGKQIGVFISCWLAVKFRWAQAPSFGWLNLYGVTILCGIGFTMSLFIGSLAFTNTHEEFMPAVRLGILAGSTLSAICGYLFLNYRLNKQSDNTF
jgi:NhaA family Na+:H+ antiporter